LAVSLLAIACGIAVGLHCRKKNALKGHEHKLPFFKVYGLNTYGEVAGYCYCPFRAFNVFMSLSYGFAAGFCFCPFRA